MFIDVLFFKMYFYFVPECKDWEYLLLSLTVFVLRETVTVTVELYVLYLLFVCADSIYLCVWYLTIYDILYCVFF